MRQSIAPPIALTTILLLSASPIAAQVGPAPLQNRPFVTTGDIHRYEMDRLRAQADQNEALARSQALQSRLTIQALQAQRPSSLPLIVSAPASTSAAILDQARQGRQATEAQTAAAMRSTRQIDDWLDRPRP